MYIFIQHIRQSHIRQLSRRFSTKTHNISETQLNYINKAALLGVPIASGQSLNGIEIGPEMLRRRGLSQYINDLRYDMIDLGDLKVIAPHLDDPISLTECGKVIKNAYSVGETTRKLFMKSSALFSAGRLPIILGGDHSLSIGSVAAALHANADIGVLWIDAHADLHTPETSPSMNIHGMPLSFLMGLSHPNDIVGFEWMNCSTYSIPKLRPERLVYIGLRDVDYAERIMLKELNIMAFTMKDIDKYGIAHVMELAMAQLRPSPNTPLHVSFDIDAVCPTWAPATGTTVIGGLSFREANYITEVVAETRSLCSLDMVEINPTLGKGYGEEVKTVDLGNILITSLLGNTII